MRPQASVIIPAYHAQGTIMRAVASLQAQTWPHWEAIIVADDGNDYETFLKMHGVADPRLRFASSGGIKTGCARPRNVGLALAQSPIIAMLDADDTFHPEKLARQVPLAARHGICTCALDYVEYTPTGKRHIATIGATGHSASLAPAAYLATNYSAHVMVVFDRTRLPIKWREDLDVLEDLAFVMAAYDYVPNIFHVGEALHEYCYTVGSLSTDAGAPARFLATKQRLLARLVQQSLGIHNPAAIAALRHFLSMSLLAEQDYARAMHAGENITFSELLAARLRIASA